MQIIKKEVGNRINSLRKQSNLTMDELAKVAKVGGRSTINGWEKGRSLPPKNSLSLIAEHFHVTEDFLLYGSLNDYVYNLIVYSFLTFQRNMKKSLDDLFKDDFSDENFKKLYLSKELHRSICYYNDAKNYETSNNKMSEERIGKIVAENLKYIIPVLIDNKIGYGNDDEITRISTKVINDNADNANNLVTTIHKINDKIDDINMLIGDNINLASLDINTDNFTLEDFINEFKENNKNNVTYKNVINTYYQIKTNSKIYKFQNDMLDISDDYSKASYKYKDKLDNKIK